MTDIATEIDRVTDQADLEAIFRALGLPSGASVIVHAGLEKLGYVVNGALDVIDAIFSVIGRQGTLLVPAHSNLTDPEQWQKPPVAKHLIAKIRATMKPFDPRLTPIFRRGMIADTLLRHPAMRRSNHPSCSVVAVGAKADWFTEQHDFDDAHGPGSPFHKLYVDSGYVLLLGVGLDVCTVVHTAEVMADCPYIYECPTRVLRTDKLGGNHFVRMRRYGGTANHFEKVRPMLASRGCLTERLIDEYRFTLMNVRPALDLIVDVLKKDPLYLQNWV